MTNHLSITTTERGFDYLPSIPSECGGNVSVHESSAASGPHIWLRAADTRYDGSDIEVILHLTAESAWKLAEQMRLLVRDHYQGDATPGSHD